MISDHIVNYNYASMKLKTTRVMFIASAMMSTLSSYGFANEIANSKVTMHKQMPDHIRVATFNVSMEATNYLERGQKPTGNELKLALKSQHQQIKNIAEIIQIVRPDILLLNEFDFIEDKTQGLEYFVKQYLNKSQKKALEAIDYPYLYIAPSNTGIPTPYDLDNSGEATGTMGDAFGFGFFPGHFGMAFLSKYPIDFDSVRTFQKFKWQDMPQALKTINPENNQPWYSDEAWANLRLSSKSHWDIPVTVGNKQVHVLAMHPTPPVFDGDEDRNGKRNHDEIRFFNDYISKGKGAYIYDDTGQRGQFKDNTRFVLLGDFNASPVEGDAYRESISALLNNPAVNNSYQPTSKGGHEHKPGNKHAKTHTAYWGMRADYVLPSSYGLTVLNGGVFWPEKSSPLHRLIETRQASSDHRLVYLDLAINE